MEKLGTSDPTLKCYLAIGGHSINEETEKLKTEQVNILIGTVGRIWDLIERKSVDLKSIQVFVIDEADLIIEQGNQMKLSSIIDHLPK